jgi:hypothetical protein
MATTFLQLQTAVKARLKEDATDTTTTNRVKECINVAYLELCAKKDWDFLRVNDTAITGTGARSYAFAAAVSKLLNVRWGTAAYDHTTRKLTKTDREILLKDINVDSTTPRMYCITKGTHIETDGIVSSPYKLYYDYIATVTALSADADAIVIPDKWAHVLKQLAYYYVLDADDDSRAKNAYAIYQTMYFDMLKYYHNGDEFDCMVSGYED